MPKWAERGEAVVKAVETVGALRHTLGINLVEKLAVVVLHAKSLEPVCANDGPPPCIFLSVAQHPIVWHSWALHLVCFDVVGGTHVMSG
jgi:hypothetical protein